MNVATSRFLRPWTPGLRVVDGLRLRTTSKLWYHPGAIGYVGRRLCAGVR